MKKTIIFVLFTLLVGFANAQIRLEFGPQLNGSSGSDFSAGAGAIVDVKYMLSKSIAVGVSAGYQHLFMASGWEDRWYQQWMVHYQNANENITPLRGTFAYYFGDKLIKPYIGAEAGLTRLHVIYDYKDSYYGILTDNYKETHFAYALGGGLDVGLGKTLALDINLKYNGGDLSYLSCKFGLVFTFGERK
jgi:hypothetical protein